MKFTKKQNAAVVAALYSLCIGHWTTEYTKETKPDKNGDPVEVTKEKKTYVEPNMTAVSFWLCNRMPEQWSKSPAAVASPTESGGVIIIPAAEEEK